MVKKEDKNKLHMKLVEINTLLINLIEQSTVENAEKYLKEFKSDIEDKFYENKRHTPTVVGRLY